MRLRYVAAIAAVLLLTVPGLAQTPAQTTAPVVEQPVVVPAPVPTPAATQNTITTTAPVTSETKISVGDLASEALDWAYIAFGGILVAYIRRWLVAAAKKAGIELTAGMSDELNAALLNGLSLADATAKKNLAGKGEIEVKSQIIADAIKYAQDHKAALIKAMGADPQSGEAVVGLRARIATLVADPTKPTPAVLDIPASVAVPAVPKVI